MADRPVDWQAWLGRYGPAALLYARQIDPQYAEDAVHDGFVRFWQKREKARDPVALFFTCVRSAALDRRRQDSRRQIRERPAGGHMPLFTAGDAETLARNEVVEKALVHLPADQREVVVLKIWAGLTFEQIAEGLSASVNTVAGRYRYGIEKLAALLRPEVMHE